MSLDARILYLPRNFRSPRSEIRFDLGPLFSCNCFVVSIVLSSRHKCVARTSNVLSVLSHSTSSSCVVKSDEGNVCQPLQWQRPTARHDAPSHTCTNRCLFSEQLSLWFGDVGYSVGIFSTIASVLIYQKYSSPVFLE